MDIYTRNLEKKIQTIKDNIYSEVTPFEIIKFKQGDLPEAKAIKFDDSKWRSFSVGQFWGGRDLTCWFRIPLVVPKIAPGKKYAVIFQPGKRYFFDASQGGDYREYELLVYLDGQPLQSVDIRRNEIMLWDKLKPGKKHILAIEAFSGLETHQHRLEQADLVCIDADTEDFYYNTKIVFETIQSTDKNNPHNSRFLSILKESILMVDFLQIGSQSFYNSIKKANEFIKKELYKDNSPKKDNSTVMSLGNSHLDIAWMWQTKHSRKKAARTFSNTLRLMEIYPEYHFIQSQAQIYTYMKESYPDIYARLKEKIKSGKLEATGGMWAESDCNIPGGESLVRQFLYGKRFFEKEFGKESKVVWLPDAFGFCYTLPQIMKKCGLKFFMTTKMSWSQFVRITDDTFYWEGLDGSKVMAYFITTPDPRGWDDYSADLNPKMMKGCWDEYQQKEENKEVLFVYGWGDGGCGPTRDMLENSTRLAYMNDLLPNHRQGLVEEFFEGLEKRVNKLTVWNDELYLQFHRGCYTSQAWIKKANRKSEILYHDTELFCAIDSVNKGTYPQDDLKKGWELILLNQFHDILPGSSIPEVYQDCREEYKQVTTYGDKHLNNALNNLSKGKKGAKGDTRLAVFNSLSWNRSDLISLPPPKGKDNLNMVDDKGQTVPVQILPDKKGTIAHIENLPSLGYNFYTFDKKKSGKVQSSIKISKNKLENQFFTINFDKKGLITSLFDKRYNREVIEKGKKANILQAFEDRPIRNNAWDIDIFYQDKCIELDDLSSVQISEKGPLRGGLIQKRKFLDSEIDQTIYIYEHIPRIDFVTEIDWQQHETLLKVAFPVNIHANTATYEIPYGSIQRPTHWNTLWDMGRFEVPAQKWADLSEGDYGVSLLNDCKYGYDIKENVMRLTLIKSPVQPDPNADIGQHRFTYSLYPHKGDWRNGGTVQEAYRLNYKPLTRLAPPAAKNEEQRPFSFAQTNRENVIIESVKKAEDGNEIVFRLYETCNQRGEVEITFAHPIKGIWESNMLEKDKKPVKHKKNVAIYNIKPYEIKTLMVKF